MKRRQQIGAFASACLGASLALGIGCNGYINSGGAPRGAGPGPGPGPGPSNPGTAGTVGGTTTTDPGLPAAGQLRRLSSAQFTRALQDLLGPVGSLPAVEES